MLDVEIKSIVKNLSSEIKFLQPLFESIVNSLESNSHNITITIKPSEVLDESLTPSVNGFVIEDDGDGFTEENIQSFNTLWSDKKIQLGCKGSGRFTWLKVFKNIDIVSYLKNGNTKIHIPFSESYSKDLIDKDIYKDEIESNKTIISFDNITSKYYMTSNKAKNVDKRELADPLLLKEAILNYLFVKLSVLKDSNYDFRISIRVGEKSETITNADIPVLNECVFQLNGNLICPVVDFKIKYVIKDDNKSNKLFYLCANNRSAHKIRASSLNVYDDLPGKNSIYLYVISDYLDEIESDDRLGIDHYASLKDTDEIHYILYSDLLDGISKSLKEIIYTKYPEVKEMAENIVKDVQCSKPYLTKYLKEIKTTIPTKENVEKIAMTNYQNDKILVSKKFEKALEKRNIDPKGFEEAIKEVTSISSAELCEYIIYRSKILNALSSEYLKDKEESYMHNIFMQKNTSDLVNDYLSTNMWVLDDKFMSYVYVSSDLPFKRINRDIVAEPHRSAHDGRRPDMFLAYDRSGDVYKNALLIEFKKYSASLEEKCKALHEIPNNIGELRRSNSNIQNIFAYIVTKLDDDFITAIKDDGSYKTIREENEGVYFYKYNENRNAHIFICDIDSLVKDASIRNKVFLDILKQ